MRARSVLGTAVDGVGCRFSLVLFLCLKHSVAPFSCLPNLILSEAWSSVLPRLWQALPHVLKVTSEKQPHTDLMVFGMRVCV